MWNRIAALMVLVTAMSLLLTPIEIEARGGGRGGGGRGGGARAAGGVRGGGGAYRGGHVMNRTPTMSRASNRPAASQVRQRPQNRPAVSQGRVQQARNTVQQRPSAANRAELRNQVNRYAQSRPAQNINRQNLAQKTQNVSSKRSNQISQNRQLSEKVSHRLQESRPDSNHWFDRNFFDRHNIDVDYVRGGANWWRPAAWATLATWGAWNWSTPYYYDYQGQAYPVAVDESINSYSYTTPTTSYQPTQSIPTPATENESWLPLGVFAIASDANEIAQTDRFIQLAINRSGDIAGVLYNSATDTAQDLTGLVDSKSQQAYWSLADRIDSPIATTGIYNLTEGQTPINVHFTDGSEQTWTLVRLQQD